MGIREKGSQEWLKNMELKFGGYTTNVKRNKVSKYDSRTVDQIKEGGMIGGDRMSDIGGTIIVFIIQNI